MFHRWRSRSSCLSMLCVVVAIQAPTPDARDSAAPRLMKLVAVLAGVESRTADFVLTGAEVPDSAAGPLGGDPAFPSSDESNELAGELWLTAGQQTIMMLHRRASGAYRPSFISRGPNPLTDQIARAREFFSGPVNFCFTDRIIALGRLTC
jgi:hypothetical protein